MILKYLVNIIIVNSAGYQYADIFYTNREMIFKDGITKASWRNMKTNYDLKGIKNENR